MMLTYSLLEVCPAAHAETARSLRAADDHNAVYHDQFDMHGLALITAQHAPNAVSLVWLNRRDLAALTGDVGGRVAMIAADTQEENPVLADLRLNDSEHEFKSTTSASPHGSTPVENRNGNPVTLNEGVPEYPPLSEPEGTIHDDGKWLCHERPYKGRFDKMRAEDRMRAYVGADRLRRPLAQPEADHGDTSLEAGESDAAEIR